MFKKNKFPDKQELALKRTRWIASCIDYLIVVAVITPLFVMIGEPGENDNTIAFVPIKGVLRYAGVWLIWLILIPGIEAFTRGRTIGKALLGLRVVQTNGDRVHILHTIIRHVCDSIDCLPLIGALGLLVASLNRRKQRVGDLMAGTIVVRSFKKKNPSY